MVPPKSEVIAAPVNCVGSSPLQMVCAPLSVLVPVMVFKRMVTDTELLQPVPPAPEYAITPMVLPSVTVPAEKV